MRWLGALALGVLIATACTGRPAQTATSLSPSPPPPAPVTASAPPCTAAQLEAKLLDRRGYTGHTDSPIGFRNRSSAPCSIEGYPNLTILDASGHVIAQVTGSGQYASFFDSPVVTVVLETNTATVHVEWYDCRSPVAARLTIDLPNNGGQLKIDYAVDAPASPICDSRETGVQLAYLGRGPFTPS